MNRKLPEIYMDDDILAINKPAGLLSIPDRFQENKANCQSLLREKYQEIFTVHRLDKDTSGALIFARNPQAHRDLSLMFEQNKVEKYYLAVTQGYFDQLEGQIDFAISADPAKPGRMKIYPKGKDALTSYQVIADYGEFALVKLQIHTGRTHQIRVHLAAIGHPLAVDPLYGKREALYIYDVKSSAKKSRDKDPVPLIKRCTLHAESLSFQHPQTHEYLTIKAELPKDMRALLNQLAKLKNKL